MGTTGLSNPNTYASGDSHLHECNCFETGARRCQMEIVKAGFSNDQMGLVDKVPKLDVGSGAYSQTARLLDEWANQPDSSIGSLVTALRTLGREDAADALLAGCSLYRITTAPTGREAAKASLPLR